MTHRISRGRRMSALALPTLLAASALAGCGGSPDDSTASSTSAGQSSTSTSQSSTSQSSGTTTGTATQGGQAQPLVASLTWPQGTDRFALNVCASIAEHTISGGGTSDSGKWNLVIDANLLKSGDTGSLTVTQKSDMTVTYDARITALTVAADGTFSGSGEDVGKVPFSITGTCDVTW